MLPVDRDDTQAAIDSLDTALGVLGKGERLRHLPRRQPVARRPALPRPRRRRAPRPDGRRARRTRRAWRAPSRIQPVGKKYPTLAKVTVKFGGRSTSPAARDGVPLGRARREVTDEIMAAIQALSGQETAGVYNDRAPDA